MASLSNPSQCVQGFKDGDSLLETTYYCQVQDEKMDVVMELKGSDKVKQSNIPQRYVLVLDVSGSMDSQITAGDSRSLLDRVKLFAKLFIQKLSSSNWLSVVIFSHESSILLHMTRMTVQGKAEATNIIDRLFADGGTDLSEGLFRGLEAAAAGFKTYDCVILFTDGLSNNGIIEPDLLVYEYQARMNLMMQNGRANHVQLAAITIGDYRPALLVEISNRLSSDAFYWLNYEYDFEADMLIPLFLREKTSLSDISVSLICAPGVTFVQNSVYTVGLQERNDENSQLSYFIYNLPKDVTKHISFSLNVSKRWRNTDAVLLAHTRYLDHDLVERMNDDQIYLRSATMKEVRDQEPCLPDATLESLDYLEKLSAYSIYRKEVTVSWESAQISFMNILNQDCRQCAINAISESSENVGTEDLQHAQQRFKEALNGVTKMKVFATTVLGNHNLYYKILSRDIDKLADNLNYGANNISKQNWARLTALVSSLSTEMPTATGVFDPDKRQLYMPPDVESQLTECSKIVHKESKMANAAAKEREINEQLEKQNKAYHQMLTSAKARDAHVMRTSLQLCRQCGIDEEEIAYFDKLLRIVEQEDILLQQIREFIKRENVEMLYESIAAFKKKGSEMMDKTGDVKRAEEAVLSIQTKREMMKLENAFTVEDVEKIASAISALKDLVAKGAQIDDKVFVQAEADLETIRTQKILRSEMEGLQNEVSKFAEAENLAELEEKINQLTNFLKEKGLKTNENDFLFLEKYGAALKTLKQKYDLMDKIKNTWERFALPDVPSSLERLVESISLMKALKEAALEYEGAFTANDEEKFVEISERVETLKEKVVQRDAAEASLQSALNARNYNDLVQAITQAESAPFVDANLMQNAQNLSDFLNPETRISALSAAMKAKDIDQLTEAIQDYNDAKVKEGSEVLERAEKRREKLIKIEEKEARRQEKIRKLNDMLLEAMEARDLDAIRSALHKCSKASKIENEEIPLYEAARELMIELIIENLRENLEDAIKSRNLSALQQAVEAVEESGYIDELADYYYKAKDLIDHLIELQKLKEAILGMDNGLISEIRGYSKPPEGVVSVMVAVMLMLGEPAKSLENWTNVQKHIGQSIKKRILKCDPNNLSPKAVDRIRNMLEGVDINQVKDKSVGASSFFAWVRCMLIETEYYFARSS